MDTVGFGDEAEEAAVAVEAPWPPQLDHLDPRLVVTVEEFVCDLSIRGFVGKFDRLRAEPLHADDRDKPVRQNAAHGGVGGELFELAHSGNPSARLKVCVWLRRFTTPSHYC